MTAIGIFRTRCDRCGLVAIVRRCNDDHGWQLGRDFYDDDLCPACSVAASPLAPEAR